MSAEGAARWPAEDVLARIAAATPEHPVTLGRYDVVGRLGAGGMGTVYGAIDRERGTRVALKTISAVDASMSVQLKREFRAVADLAHPNLAAVFELCHEQGLSFFVMERVDGLHFTAWARANGSEDTTLSMSGDLSGRMSAVREKTEDVHQATTREVVIFEDDAPPTSIRASAPTQSFANVRRAFAELVRGLSALHDAGLWHGDVKPANVLVRPDGRVVVVDFGLARPVDATRAMKGPLPGTPVFMAPEQLAGEGAGPASDWHAVGAMLYEVLTGWPPFRGASLLDLYFKKSHEVPTSPRELVPEIPEDLSDVCMQLLRPEPDLRPSGAELLRVLGDGKAREHARSSRNDSSARSFFVGRQHELSQLEQAYRRARAGKRTIAHVHGASGIGKTTIVRRFLRGVHHVEQARVLRGRCYERESVPYKAFDGIVDDLAELLRGMHLDAIERMLPDHVGELARVFPALFSVPGLSARAQQAVVPNDGKELRRRAWAALSELFASLGRNRPLVLSIDDLQWADVDSVLLLDALLRDTAEARLLVIASYRPEEASRNELLVQHLDASRSIDRGRGFIDVPVAGLPAREAEALARATLRGLSAASDDAHVQEIVREARGVPFFVEELGRYAATHEGALISLDRAIAARLRALPDDQRALMEVVAIADAPVPQSLVFEAAALEASALPALLSLRSASMLGWTGASASDLVSTYHDRIRESVVASMDERARAERHLALGRALAARHGRDDPGSWVFAAVRHLGAARELLVDEHERVEAARLHLRAGRLARSAAAFPLAFRCFEGGIALLGESAWERHYQLALGLHAGSAEAAYLTADWATLDVRVATLKARGRTVMDQLVAWELAIDAQVGRHDYAGAIATTAEVLSLLGVDLVVQPERAQVEAAFVEALSALQRVGPEGLAALPDVQHAESAAAMRVLIRVSPAAYFGRPLLLPVIASKLIVTSIERGLSPATGFALALFGIVMNTVGMHPEAHAWGQLAVKLIDRWPDRSLEAATRHVVFNLVCTWMVPLHTILAPLREVFDIGVRIGDFEYGSYAAHGYVHHALYASRPLAPLLDEAVMLGEKMRALGQVNALHVHTPFEQLLKCLAGAKANPATLDDDAFSEAELLARSEAEGSRSGIFVARIVMGLARWYFGDVDHAHANLVIAREYADAAPSVWHVPIMHQFGGLAACAAWERTRDATTRKLIEESVDALRALAKHAPVNFAHRVSLIEGELARVEGRRDDAVAHFSRAMNEAREGGYANDVALAHELRARCTDDPASDLAAARELYAQWGAAAKVRQLDASIS